MSNAPSRMSANPVSSVDHYENFPVASLLVPARLRPAIAAIYRFARHADDLADEGDAAPAQRIAELDALSAALRSASPSAPVVAALRPHMRAHALPVEPFEALLSAFRQDVVTSRYRSFDEILDYCSRSADPVGELVLRLFGAWREDTRTPSSRICSALQLINFLQDTAVDWRRGRLYLPLDELAAAGLGEADLEAAAAAGRASPALRAFLEGQAARARRLLESGAPLATSVPRRLGWELRAIVAGGLRILDRLAQGGHDPFAGRPALGWRDAPALIRLWLRPSR
ncbi:squalene synthase HpnC [Burkholderiaceae bacterium FT117]|uniref:squalene synthase HpnC n=1 Tax=Zeimonas sediminis TaxID=2944268 RepID=UPI0023431877|nr:squalene synthase HpnC [Zeimonas sediminis]MCM5569149.1 squalene synthase HpnC [Zeimonas sediminis]